MLRIEESMACVLGPVILFVMVQVANYFVLRLKGCSDSNYPQTETLFSSVWGTVLGRTLRLKHDCQFIATIVIPTFQLGMSVLLMVWVGYFGAVAPLELGMQVVMAVRLIYVIVLVLRFGELNNESRADESSRSETIIQLNNMRSGDGYNTRGSHSLSETDGSFEMLDT